MGKQFYVRVGSSLSGPFTSQQLTDLAANGSLLPHHEVSIDQRRWYRAARVKGLSFLSSERPPLRVAMPIEKTAGGANVRPAPLEPPSQLPVIKTQGVSQSRRDGDPRRSEPHATQNHRLLLLVGGAFGLLVVCGLAWVLFGPGSLLRSLRTPINVKGWYTTGRLSSSMPFGSGIELTEEARKAGMQFLVVDVTIPVTALDARKLSPTELDEYHKKNEEFNRERTSGAHYEEPRNDVIWTYEVSLLHMKLHTLDGRTIPGGAMKSIGGYIAAGWQAYSSREPTDQDITVVFSVEKRLIDDRALEFQYKDFPRVRLTSDLKDKPN